MREINSITELHGILLDIGKEFHRICVKNNIPYYILGGTMLGAVRHKGFIPWDDDMDFGVPRKYFKQCLIALKKDLSSKYEILTIDNSDSIFIDIIKISDKRTEMNEIYKEDISDKVGINIDIFPLDSIKNKDFRIKVISLLIRLQYYVFLSVKSRPFHKKMIALFIKLIFSFLNKRTIVDFINKYLINNGGEYIANIYGAWGEKEIVVNNIMGRPTLYTFEDTAFYGVENYSLYLSSLYGNYMELPPKDKRHLHIKNVYWK